MPKTTNLSVQNEQASPDYTGLVKHLLQPFLDVPDSLVVDCEQLNSRPKIWLRVAFEGSDRGKVFGRGGRNIHAIKTVLATAAIAAGQSLHFDVYGAGDESKSSREFGGDRDRESDRGSGDRGRQGQGKYNSRRSNHPKSPPKFR